MPIVHPTSPVQVTVSLPATPDTDGRGESATFWAQPLPDHVATTSTHLAARVETLLIHTPFTLHDIVHLTTADEGEFQVVGVVERSPHITMGVALKSHAEHGSEGRAEVMAGKLAAAAESAGAVSVCSPGGIVGIQVPDNSLKESGTIIGWLESLLVTAGDDVMRDHVLSFEVTHTPNHPTTK